MNSLGLGFVLDVASDTEDEMGRNDLRELAGTKVLITGGLGLIGSVLAHRLVSAGADVLLVDSLNENFGGNLFNVDPIKNLLRINISDIRDKHGLRFLLRDSELIFNLAGQTSHLDSMNAPFEDMEINCVAQLSLLEVCRQINPGVRIVYASTRQIYGRPEYLPVDEKHRLAPVDVNGINKIAGESYHLLYNQVYGLRTTVLRLTNTYGPHMRIKDSKQVFLGLWVRRVVENLPFEVWGGNQMRDFTFVDDAADAFIAAALSPETIGKALNVGGCKPVSLIDLAALLVEANGGGSFEKREFPIERKKIDIGDYYTDDTAFRGLTGWSPKIDVKPGLERSVKYYRENLHRYL
jgi:UDP-glucose 4-epimerase